MMMSFSLLVVIMSLQSLSLWWLFEISAYMFCFFFLWKVVSMFASYEMVSDWFAYDCMSNLLILLTFLIIGLMISASYNSVLFVKKNLLLFSYLSFFMLFFLYVTFYSLSVINFYIFFEVSLIPIFLMIMGWGYQPERLQASMYMLFYTLFASLPLLVIILLEQENFSSFLPFAQQYPVLSSNGTLSLVMSFFLIFAFLVKLPTFTVHLWLPKAHVEAPVAGSMILAGVLLKLGGFGIWRVLSKFYPDFYYSLILIILGLVGGVVVSFICSIQIDMKALVAYSSIVHMGIMLAGLGTFTSYGFEGALCMMLGHGVVSSGLFYMVGLNYDRIGSRSLIMNKGLMIVFPAATISWFMLSVFNISAPPSLSLMSEILLTTSLLFSSVSLTIFLMMMNFMSMVYTFYLYAQSQQGKIFDSIINLMMLSVREYMVSFSHVIVALVMFLFFWLF